MRASTILFSLLILCCLGMSGCASARKRHKKEKPAQAAPQPVLVGTISLVNAESKFVLIDGGMSPTPPADLPLKSYTKDVESAELITSRERRRPFVIADIKSGTPLKGDRVFTVIPNSRPPAPSTTTTGNPPPPSAGNQTAPDFLPQIQLSPAAALDQ